MPAATTERDVVAEFLTGFQHEILNPLAGALGALHVMRDVALSPSALADVIESVERELRRIEDAVRGFGDASALRRVSYVNGATMLVPGMAASVQSR